MARTTFLVRITGPGPYDWEVQCVAEDTTIDAAIDLADYVRQRLLRGGAIEVVTPGYHNDPQGATMSFSSPLGCGDPRCPQCNPQKELADSILRQYSAPVFTWDFPGITKPKEQSMSTNTQRVINDLRELDESELPRISAEVEAIKRRKENRIAEGLDGLVTLELLKDSDVRRFVIAYYQNGEAKTAKGVEFGDTKMVVKDDIEKMHRVYVQGRDYPMSGPHYTMPRLRERLEKSDIVYRIAYYGEDED